MTKIPNILTINNKNLKELKSFIIKISQAIYIYEILGKEDTPTKKLLKVYNGSITKEGNSEMEIREISSEYRQSTLQYPGPYGVSPGYC